VVGEPDQATGSRLGPLSGAFLLDQPAADAKARTEPG
jgi:hypothetical protein